MNIALTLNPVLKGIGKIAEDKIITKTNPDLEWNLLEEDVSLPAAVLDLQKINHNLSWMQDFADSYGIKLCPHGKTTLCPYLFRQQLKTGAWGISLASATQVKIAHSAGIPRVLMVNQLIGKANMSIISDILRSDPTFEIACLVDSPRNVQQLGKYFGEQNQLLRVLLEIGFPGCRTGVRDVNQENLVIAELEKYQASLSLVGVEFYEGIVKSENGVRDCVRRVGERTQHLVNCGAFRELPIIISGAGSTWFDIVAEELSLLDIRDNTLNNIQVELVLRPGSYLTHEIGTYQNAKERVQKNTELMRAMGGPRAPMMTALQIWAYVQSIPESRLAVIAMGKREADVSFDCQFPIPVLHFRPGVFKTPVPAKSDWRVSYVMDQHSFMTVEENDDIQVGDIVAFEICYPGTTLDKFRSVLLMDEHFNIVDVLQTYF